jgi:hypothetical protein
MRRVRVAGAGDDADVCGAAEWVVGGTLCGPGCRAVLLPSENRAAAVNWTHDFVYICPLHCRYSLALPSAQATKLIMCGTAKV